MQRPLAMQSSVSRLSITDSHLSWETLLLLPRLKQNSGKDASETCAHDKENHSQSPGGTLALFINRI